jgi:molybdopterin-guanine dinucleotide biosynthesis protein
MMIIGIAGAHSGIGKTTLCELLLRELTKTTNNEGRFYNLDWGAIKYTRSSIYCSLSTDLQLLWCENKDTARMLKAGAKEVVWVQSPPERLQEVLPMAIDRLSHLGGILVEGNSAVEFLRPDIVVFLDSKKVDDRKPSAERLIAMADIIIQPILRETDQGANPFAHFVETGLDTLDPKVLLGLIEEGLDEKAVGKELSARAEAAKITCKDAREIAERLSVSYGLVGKMADRMEIKITQCELGCF